MDARRAHMGRRGCPRQRLQYHTLSFFFSSVVTVRTSSVSKWLSLENRISLTNTLPEQPSFRDGVVGTSTTARLLVPSLACHVRSPLAQLPFRRVPPSFSILDIPTNAAEYGWALVCRCDALSHTLVPLPLSLIFSHQRHGTLAELWLTMAVVLVLEAILAAAVRKDVAYSRCYFCLP
jgi:hypothetical protein